jgi:hypothetical protein
MALVDGLVAGREQIEAAKPNSDQRLHERQGLAEL